MSTKSSGRETTVVGELVEATSSGSLSLDRIKEPNGHWVWSLRVFAGGGDHLATINFTMGGLVSLRDIVSRAIVLEQGVSAGSGEEGVSGG